MTQEYSCPKCDKPAIRDATVRPNSCECRCWLIYDNDGNPTTIKLWMDDYLKIDDNRLDLSINIKDNSWTLFNLSASKVMCQSANEVMCQGEDAYSYWPFKDREAMTEKLRELLFWW